MDAGLILAGMAAGAFLSRALARRLAARMSADRVVVLGLGDHDAVDERSRNQNLARMQRSGPRDPFDLDDDNATRVLDRHGHSEVVEIERLALAAGEAADRTEVAAVRLADRRAQLADTEDADVALVVPT